MKHQRIHCPYLLDYCLVCYTVSNAILSLILYCLLYAILSLMLYCLLCYTVSYSILSLILYCLLLNWNRGFYDNVVTHLVYYSISCIIWNTRVIFTLYLLYIQVLGLLWMLCSTLSRCWQRWCCSHYSASQCLRC